MKRNLLLVAAGVLVMVVFQAAQDSRLRGESPQKQEPDSTMAVLDVMRVLKEHEQFNKTINAMKEEIQQVEANLRADRDAIEIEAAEVQKLDKKSDAYKKGDEDILKRKSDFNLKATRERKVFLDREADAYLDTYRHIQRVVTEYAQSHSIRFVLRVSTEEEPKDREGVLKLINRPVVYADQLDITSAIIDAVNYRDITEP